MSNSQSRCVWSNGKDGISLAAVHGNGGRLFGDVLAVRGAGMPPDAVTEFPFDPYSEHYSLRVGPEPVGCLTVTRLLAGPLDCQQFYPEVLLDTYRGVIASACKFRLLPNRDLPLGRGRRVFVQEAWRDQLARGARLDVINAAESLVRRRYYERQGYVLDSRSRFIHPTLRTSSWMMFLAADPTAPSALRELLVGLDAPLLISDVQRTLDVHYERRLAPARHVFAWGETSGSAVDAAS